MGPHSQFAMMNWDMAPKMPPHSEFKNQTVCALERICAPENNKNTQSAHGSCIRPTQKPGHPR